MKMAFWNDVTNQDKGNECAVDSPKDEGKGAVGRTIEWNGMGRWMVFMDGCVRWFGMRLTFFMLILCLSCVRSVLSIPYCRGEVLPIPNSPAL